MVVTALLFHIAEPTENLADVPEDQIVETIETSDGPVASTVEHVHEIAKDVHKLALFSVCLRLSLSLSHTCSSIIWFLIIPFQGFHCVLCLCAEDLTRPGVASLTPIVLLLNPKRGFKIKLHSAPGHIHVGQMGNNQPATFQPEQIRELGRKYKLYITGEWIVCHHRETILVNSPFTCDSYPFFHSLSSSSPTPPPPPNTPSTSPSFQVNWSSPPQCM